ncbi:MAG: type II secretion system F family protein [Planctomycetota bacterium]
MSTATRSRARDHAEPAAPAGASKGTPLSSRQVLEFGRYLRTFQRAGFSMAQGLAIIAQQTRSRRLREVCQTARGHILAGTPLSCALEHYHRDFPPLFLGALVAGEESGALDETLANVLEWLKQEEQVRRGIAASLRYPKMLAIVIGAALLVVLLLIVPRFEPLFRSYKNGLPAPTRVLLWLGDTVRSHGVDLVIAGAVLAAIVQALLRGPRLRARFERWRHRWPLFGANARDSQVARISATLALLHRAGLPMLKALAGGCVGRRGVRRRAGARQGRDRCGHHLARGRGPGPAVLAAVRADGRGG